MFLEGIKNIILKNELISDVEITEENKSITIYPRQDINFNKIENVLNDFEKIENREWSLCGVTFKMMDYNYMNTTVYDVTMRVTDKYEEDIICKTLEEVKYNANMYIGDEVKLKDIDHIGSSITNAECEDFNFESAVERLSWSFCIKRSDGEYIEDTYLDIQFEVIEDIEDIENIIVKITNVEII